MTIIPLAQKLTRFLRYGLCSRESATTRTMSLTFCAGQKGPDCESRSFQLPAQTGERAVSGCSERPLRAFRTCFVYGSASQKARISWSRGNVNLCVSDLVEAGPYPGRFRRSGEPGRSRKIWSVYLAYHVGSKQGGFAGEFKAYHDDGIFQAQRRRPAPRAELRPRANPDRKQR